MKKSLIIILIVLVILMVFSATSCQTKTPPTIELKIYYGPELIGNLCVYRVEAIVSGYPEPNVYFSRNDGSQGANKCQINLENPEEHYLLEVTARNSVGETTSQLLFEWGCKSEVVEPAEREEEIIVEEVIVPIQEKLNQIEEQYSLELRQEIELIQNELYKEKILSDDYVIEALGFFNEYGHADILLEKGVALNEFGITHLYEILENEEKEMIDDYIANVTDASNENVIAFILQSNLLDWYVAYSAYISKEFNIPYFVISNKDGSFIPQNDYPEDYTLEEQDISRIRYHPMYDLIYFVYDELNFARDNYETDSIKIDKNKEEVLFYLNEIIKEYDTIYFFVLTHANDSLAIFSSGGLENLYNEEIYEILEKVERNINFKIVANHCFDIFEKQLEKKLNGNTRINYSFLNAATELAKGATLLEAIIYSNNGIITIKELEEICEGKNADQLVDSPYGEKVYIYSLDEPPFGMDIYCDGKYGISDFKLKSNTNDKSIFYIRLNYFK